MLKHYCGNGFKGKIVKARGIAFCSLCGKEFKGGLKMCSQKFNYTKKRKKVKVSK